jgi:hypothetical protein
LVVGRVNWSPDFKADKNGDVWLQKALNNGTIKLAPRMVDNELVSVDLVKADPSEPKSQEEVVDLRPHREGTEKQTELFGLLLGGIEKGEATEVGFTYTNWKGKTSRRRAKFTSFWWGTSHYHPEPQMLIHGFDIDKQARRTYAAKDISDLKLV